MPTNSHRKSVLTTPKRPLHPGSGLTLFGFTDKSAATALDDIRSRARSLGGPPEIDIIEGRSLSAIVGPVHKFRRFRSSEYNRLICLEAQQSVLEATMEEARVLPAALATTLPSRKDVLRLLNTHGSRLQAQMERFGDLIEMEIVISWDVNEVVRSILMTDGLEIPDGSRSNRNMARALELAIESRRRSLQANIESAIQAVCEDSITVGCNDQSILNRHVVLVSNPKEDQLFAILHQIIDCGGGKISMKCIGPLPPCSFASVRVWKSQADEVVKARSDFRLGQTAAMSEIRAAYQDALGSRGADQTSATHGTGSGSLGRLKSSYDLLTQIAEGQHVASKNTHNGMSLSPDRLVRLDPSAIGETYLVAIERAKPHWRAA